MKNEYFMNDITRITGVERLRLHHWMKEGFFTPSGQVGKGHGTKNVFTREDLYQIMLLKKLIENGLHGRIAKSLLTYDFNLLRALHQKNGPVLSLSVILRFSEDKSVEIATFDNLGDLYPQNNKRPLHETISDLFCKGYDTAIIVNLAKVINEVDSHL